MHSKRKEVFLYRIYNFLQIKCHYCMSIVLKPDSKPFLNVILFNGCVFGAKAEQV